MWKHFQIDIGGKTVTGITTGTGSRLLLALHGFGNDATLFHCLQPLAGQYTIVAIDLPFHGRNHWRPGDMLTAKDTVTLVDNLLAQYGLQKLTICGYSLGGRLALKTTELAPDNVEKLVLLAADGLVRNRVYNLATGTIVGRLLFKYSMLHPGWLIALATLAGKTRLMSVKKTDFVLRQLTSPQLCRQTLDVWLATCQLVPRKKLVQLHINTHQIETVLVMGKKDQIIPAKNGISFAQGCPRVQLRLLDAGHWLWTAPLAEQIRNILKY